MKYCIVSAQVGSNSSVEQNREPETYPCICEILLSDRHSRVLKEKTGLYPKQEMFG